MVNDQLDSSFVSVLTVSPANAGVTMRFVGDVMNWTNYTFSFGISGFTYCKVGEKLTMTPESYLRFGKGTFAVFNTITQYKILIKHVKKEHF